MEWLRKKSGLVEGIDFQQVSDGSAGVLLKVEGKWKHCTWHHHQDGKTLIPVITDIHKELIGKHTGGATIIYPKPQDYTSLIGFFNL